MDGKPLKHVEWTNYYSFLNVSQQNLLKLQSFERNLAPYSFPPSLDRRWTIRPEEKPFQVFILKPWWINSSPPALMWFIKESQRNISPIHHITSPELWWSTSFGYFLSTPVFLEIPPPALLLASTIHIPATRLANQSLKPKRAPVTTKGRDLSENGWERKVSQSGQKTWLPPSAQQTVCGNEVSVILGLHKSFKNELFPEVLPVYVS